MVEPFQGYEPEVGEIRALRTFRVGPGGLLYPLFGNTAWVAGDNTAECRRPDVDQSAHRPADGDCSCGFYAYATAEAAEDYPHAAHVLAAVSCWGRVVAGTRGLRAEHARVDALWLSPAVPAELVAEVARANPDVEIFTDRAAMIARHPPTVLDCYESEHRASDAHRLAGWRAAIAGVIALGLVPAHWWTGAAGAALWLTVAALLVVAALIVRSPTPAASRRRRAILFAAVLWAVAPLAGSAGLLLLRLPLAEVALLGLVNAHRMRRSAATFPARVG